MTDARDRTVTERRRGDEVILEAIETLREEMARHLGQQDTNIAAHGIIAKATADKVETLEKVLTGPIKLVKATEGALTFAQLVGGVAAWVVKVGAGIAVAWAVWKYAIVEAIRMSSK